MRYVLSISLVMIILIFPCHISAQERNITIEERNIPLAQVLKLLEQQTRYSIGYVNTGLNTRQLLNVSLRDVSLTRALDTILEGTRFTYRMVGYHIVLVPDNTSGESQSTVSSFSFHGSVSDQNSGEPLAYATVTLLDSLSMPVLSGVTNNQGFFRMETEHPVYAVRVTHVGYLAVNRPLNYRRKETDLGNIGLTENQHLLDETVITASSVANMLNKSRYIITSRLREGISTTLELFGRIQGLRYDRLSSEVLSAEGKPVLLLVDGVEQSPQFISNLSPEHIEAIEVVAAPIGRYVTDGYTSLVNVLLKEDYRGYDIYVHTQGIVTPGSSNGGEWLAGALPGASVNYTHHKFSAYANYQHTSNRWNTPVSRYKRMDGWVETDSEPIRRKVPVNLYGYDTNNWEASLNFQPDYRHQVSLHFNYLNEREDNRDRFAYTNTYLHDGNTVSLNSLTTNKTKADDYSVNATYKGTIGERLKLHGNLLYNHYTNRVQSNFEQNNDFRMDRFYSEGKNYLSFNAEASYRFSSTLNLDLLYTFVRRRYTSESAELERLLRHNEYRNRGFASVGWQPDEKWSVVAGIGIEEFRNNFNEFTDFENRSSSTYFVQPHLRVTYRAGKNFRMNMAYTTSSEYANLFQLSRATIIIDSLSVQVGNPELKPAFNKHFSFSMDYTEHFTLKATYSHSNNSISEIARESNLTTFENVRTRQYMVQAIYNQPFGRYVRLKGSMAWFKDRTAYEEYRNSTHGWLFDSEFTYYNPDFRLEAALGYSRNMRRHALAQGYYTTGLDSWVVSLNKQFMDGKLSLTLSWFPPLKWGVRHIQRKEIQTPLYTEQYELSTKPYQNMFLARVGFRFGSGKVKRPGKTTSVSKEKRATRTVDFR